MWSLSGCLTITIATTAITTTTTDTDTDILYLDPLQTARKIHKTNMSNSGRFTRWWHNFNARTTMNL